MPMIYKEISQEGHQLLPTRKDLYLQIEEKIGIPLISYYTSFRYPVMIDDSDADLLQDVLQANGLEKGFALLLSSPGGDGLAAERIINICREYSGTGEFIVIVPGKAKSAATMICFGSSKIIMGKASELGPIDPQIVISENGKQRGRFSVYNIVNSYEKLFRSAVAEEGHLEPYLQQLANYDAREIEEYKSIMELSGDIAVKCLRKGMMKKLKVADIKKKISRFLTPKKSKVHGRPIYANEALRCGLNIEVLPVDDELWQLIYKLHRRLDNYVSTKNTAKCVETKETSASTTLNNS